MTLARGFLFLEIHHPFPQSSAHPHYRSWRGSRCAYCWGRKGTSAQPQYLKKVLTQQRNNRLLVKCLYLFNSHMEVTKRWLEPLLEYVRDNPRGVAAAIMRSMLWKTTADTFPAEISNRNSLAQGFRFQMVTKCSLSFSRSYLFSPRQDYSYSRSEYHR